MTASKQSINPLDRLKISNDESEESLQWMASVLQSSLFSEIPTSNLQEIFDLFEPRNVVTGDIIIKQGDHGDYYYLIQSGRYQVSRRASDTAEDTKLAELIEGDHFGEEALIGSTLRNATVSVVSDGVLLRLKEDDFLRLIKDPTLEMLSLSKAQEMIDKGAVWLDVRSPAERKNHGMDESINIPLNILRAWSDKLDQTKYYIVYCDNGARSSIASFLLAQLNFTVSCLEGGLLEQGVMKKVDDTEKVDMDAISDALSTVLTNVYTLLEEALKEKADPEEARKIADKVSSGLLKK